MVSEQEFQEHVTLSSQAKDGKLWLWWAEGCVVFLALLKDIIIQAHSSLFWACQGGWGGVKDTEGLNN